MPKIYEYLGIIILFYSNEHEPIHVHGKYQGQESKAEFIIENGMVVEIIIRTVRGRKPLPPNILNDFSKDFRHIIDELQLDIDKIKSIGRRLNNASQDLNNVAGPEDIQSIALTCRESLIDLAKVLASKV